MKTNRPFGTCGVSRRQFLQHTGMGFTGVALSSMLFKDGVLRANDAPAFTPPDLGRAVALINASVEAAGRPVDWVHVPVLNKTDHAYYAPFKEINTGKSRLYMGMIHSMESLAHRIAAARSAVPAFGLAAYCGFGRTPPGDLPRILEDHQKAVEIARRG